MENNLYHPACTAFSLPLPPLRLTSSLFFKIRTSSIPGTLLSRHHVFQVPYTLHSRYHAFQVSSALGRYRYHAFQVSRRSRTLQIPCIPGITPHASRTLQIPCIPGITPLSDVTDTMHSRYHAPREFCVILFEAHNLDNSY